MKLRAAFLAATLTLLSTSAAHAVLSSSEKGQIRDFVSSARAENAVRVRALVARTDLTADESLAALSEAVVPVPFTDARGVFLRELTFGVSSASSRPLLARAVTRALLLRADAVFQKYVGGLDHEPRAIAELIAIYSFLDGTIANAGRPTLAAHDQSAGISVAAYEDCSKELRDHVERNSRWLKGDGVVAETLGRVRAQAQTALLDMLPDGMTRRVDAADRLGLQGNRRKILTEWGILFADSGKLDDAAVGYVYESLGRLPGARVDLEVVYAGEDRGPLRARGIVAFVGGGAADPNPFGAELTPLKVDAATATIVQDLVVIAVKRALDNRGELRLQAEHDAKAAQGDAGEAKAGKPSPAKMLGKPRAPSVEHVVGAAAYLLVIDAPRALLSTALLVVVACASLAGCSAKTGERERDQARALAASPAPTANELPFGPPRPPPLDRALRVIVGGDVLPHRPSLIAPAAIHAALAPLGPLFAKADSVIANYEAATGDVDPKAFRLAYAAPPGWLEELPKAGLRAVSVANNHACDLGEPGLDATLEAAQKSGLLALGADASDPWAPRAIVEQNGKRICAIAWTTLSNSEGGCSKSRHLAVAPLNGVGKQRIDRAFAKARMQCDATIAIFHGGAEYAPQTTLVMDQAAHAAEAGADAVIIHHPHIASPVVVHKAKDGRSVPLFASVGNLVTNQGESWKPPMFPVLPEDRHLVCVNGWTRLGVLADLSFTFDANAKRPRLDWGTHLLWIDNEHAEDRTVAMPKIEARLLDPSKDKAIVEALSKDRRGPLALFSDPCWIERDGAAPHDTRCASTSAPSSAELAAAAAVPSRAGKRATARRKK